MRRFRKFLEANNILIGDFPAEMFLLTTLLEVLLEENGATGISDKGTGGRQHDVGGAVLDGDLTPEKSGITGHAPVSSGVVRGSIVRKDSPADCLRKRVENALPPRG